MKMVSTSNSSTGMPLRVVVVADVRLYCEGLAAALPREKVHIVGSAQNREMATTAIHTLQPQAVLVDVTAPEALELMRQVRMDRPSIHVIAFGLDDDVSMIVSC